ncbi:MAG: TraR/DksA family transcriptional regulator [candidate division KSB1 bacterium]|nr:TraR/DksA family transcriptional regulator [candidate division KSB1 bacterium]
MEKERLAHFKQLLESYKAEIINKAASKVMDFEGHEDEFADWADRASHDESKNFLLFLEDGEAKELREIDFALSKIERGTYGLCENCENPISEERLEAIPTTRLCLECKKTEEFYS